LLITTLAAPRSKERAMKSRYVMFAAYTQWVSERLYGAAAALCDQDYRADPAGSGVGPLKRARDWRRIGAFEVSDGIGPLPRRRVRIWRTNKLTAASLSLALTLSACSGDSGWLSKSDAKFDFGLSTPKVPNDEPKQRVVTANDLIGANGRCAGEAVPDAAAAPQALNFTAGPQARPATPTPPPPGALSAGAPALRTGVALGMTECEVVRAIGHTDRIEISTNERGQRSVTLTYLQGEHPGVYRFVAGQLASLERAGEPPAPPKAAKARKAAKKQPPG
jgi:hypothetical protein